VDFNYNTIVLINSSRSVSSVWLKLVHEKNSFVLMFSIVDKMEFFI